MMADRSDVKVTIAFTDPDLEAEEKDEEVQRLLNQMKDLDEVEAVDRVIDPNPPEGNKAAGGFLVGLLLAEVSKENFKKLMGFLSDRLGNKPIKLKVKAPDGRELELEANSQAEFDYAYQKAQDFLKGT
jgi:ATP-dependent exoDNAse (exonuclease V) alpha subunit